MEKDLKKEPASPHTTELHRNPRPLLRAALIGAAYLSAFIILDLITKQFEALRGVVAWYPPAGLTYALLLVFGLSFTPAVTAALFISSVFIYRMPQPLHLLLLWAFIISLVYAAAAAFLRRRIRFDGRLQNLRDVAWLVAGTVLVSALLAVLSVSSSALSSDMPQSEILRAIFEWWIGETVGVLTVTPFLLMYGMPWLKRFAEGRPDRPPVRRSLPRSTLSGIGQAASIVFVLYWVFGARVLDEFQPVYLLTLPLIWIALQRGIKGISAALMGLNIGVVLSLWLFQFDLARLGELELLMIINCIVGLLVGAVVTERRQAEEALRESEEKFRNYIEYAPDGIFIVDDTGRYIDANPSACRILGYSKEAILKMSIRDLLAEESVEDGLSHFRNINEMNEARSDLWHKHKDGSKRCLTVSAVKLTGTRFLGFCKDITERKLAEAELRQSEARFRILFEQAGDVILQLEITPEGIPVIREANSATLRVLGYDRDELIGRPVSFIEGAPDSAKIIGERRQNILSGTGTVFEVQHRCKDGTLRNFESSVAEMKVGSKNYAISVERDITERTRSVDRIRRQLEHLTAMSAIDRAIASNFDLMLNLSEILSHVTTELGMDAADILILNSTSKMLEFCAEHGFRTKAVQRGQIRLGESHAGRAALERHLVHISNLRDEPEKGPLAARWKGEEFVCYYGLPLISKGQVKGVLEVFHRTALEPDAEWFDFLNSLAGQTAIAIENSTLFESLQRSNVELTLAYDATIEGWSRALDLRDKETEGHTQRVTEMTVKLAGVFGLSNEELAQARWGALLHDIGKMGVPDGILLKPEPLTDEEWVAMKKHPTFAYEMLAPIGYLRLALDIPYCHHEKWDGTGYPRGLKGAQIPLIARIFAVVDVWDALRSDRPYRAAWKEEKVREHIRTLSGTDFDPQVVDFFMRNWDSFDASSIHG